MPRAASPSATTMSTHQMRRHLRISSVCSTFQIERLPPEALFFLGLPAVSPAARFGLALAALLRVEPVWSVRYRSFMGLRRLKVAYPLSGTKSRPVMSSYACMYFAEVFSMMPDGRAGAGGFLSQPESV